jgi:hypothetical protein
MGPVRLLLISRVPVLSWKEYPMIVKELLMVLLVFIVLLAASP